MPSALLQALERERQRRDREETGAGGMGEHRGEIQISLRNIDMARGSARGSA